MRNFLLFIAVYLLCRSKVELGQLSRVTFFSQADAKVGLRKWSFCCNAGIDCDVTEGGALSSAALVFRLNAHNPRLSRFCASVIREKESWGKA